MKTNTLVKKLRGYQKAPRDRFSLLSEKLLSTEEWTLYELALAITDWDKTHETYGTFFATNREIAEILGWESASTAGRHKASLISKGYLLDAGDGKFTPKDFEQRQLRKTQQAFSQQDIANTQHASPFLHETNAENEQDTTQTSKQSLVSFKDHLGSSSSFPDSSSSGSEGEFSSEQLIADFEAAEARGEIQ